MCKREKEIEKERERMEDNTEYLINMFDYRSSYFTQAKVFTK